MARTREIQAENLHGVVDFMSRSAKDRPVRIEVENRDIGDQEMVRFLPLIGIDFDPKGTERGTIEISVEAEKRGCLSHFIENPSHVFLQETDAGAVECVEIEESGGGKTLIFFEQPLELPAEFPYPHEHAPAP